MNARVLPRKKMIKKLLCDWAKKREAEYRDKHAAKLPSIAFDDIKAVSGYKFKDPKTEQEVETGVVVVRTRTTDKGNPRFHSVVIGFAPGTTDPMAWCGDKAIERLFPEKDNECEFFIKRQTKPDYCCKHIQAALTWIAHNDRIAEDIANGLDSVLPEKMRASIPEPENENEKDAKTVLDAGMPVLFYGPTGSGKSWLAAKLIEKSGRKPFHIHVSDGLEDVDLLQKLIPAGDGKGWKRLPGEIVNAFTTAEKEPVIVLLEEVTRSSKSMRNMLIHVLDRKGSSYQLHNWTSGRHYRVSIDRIQWIATANLGGGYNDANELDPALMRRFGSAIHIDYDTAAERRLLHGMGLEKDLSDKMVSVGSQLRTQFREGRLPRPLDTASILDWGKLVKAGMSPLRAAQRSWVPRVVEIDRHGYPEQGHVSTIEKLIQREIGNEKAK